MSTLLENIDSLIENSIDSSAMPIGGVNKDSNGNPLHVIKKSTTTITTPKVKHPTSSFNNNPILKPTSTPIGQAHSQRISHTSALKSVNSINALKSPHP